MVGNTEIVQYGNEILTVKRNGINDRTSFILVPWNCEHDVTSSRYGEGVEAQARV